MTVATGLASWDRCYAMCLYFKFDYNSRLTGVFALDSYLAMSVHYAGLNHLSQIGSD